MELISRKAAKAAGLTHYFTGKPCKRGGHVDRRHVSSFMCMTCGREKALDAYHSLEGDQREQQLARNRVRSKKWNLEHREDLRPGKAARRQLHKQTHPDYFKQHYATNRERRKQESAEWYRANAEYALERSKAYAAKRLVENPDHVRAIGRKNANTRRAITNGVFVEVVDPRVVFTRDNGVCGICKLVVDPASPWEVDHVFPISRGGVHAYANVQLAHRRCNRAKDNRLPGELNGTRRRAAPAPNRSP